MPKQLNLGSFDQIISDRKSKTKYDLTNQQARDYLYFLEWYCITYIEKAIYQGLETRWQEAIEYGGNPQDEIQAIIQEKDQLIDRSLFSSSSIMTNLIELHRPKVYTKFIQDKQYQLRDK